MKKSWYTGDMDVGGESTEGELRLLSLFQEYAL